MSDKCSDKNVGSIEEDIKILENLKSYLNLLAYEGKDKIIYNDLLWDEKTVDCINAIEHLINDYTRQKQINEEHQKINGKLRERVKELEEENAMLKKASNIAKDVNIEDVTDVINKSCKEFMSNYIPKQAVIEALEDIEDYFDRLNGPDEDIEYIRQVKQELLGGEKNNENIKS